jgi:beta-glucosidase
VQLYLRDPVASMTRPVRRLRGSFRIDRGDVGFYDNEGRFRVEPGRIDLYAGSDSTADLSASFEVTP